MLRFVLTFTLLFLFVDRSLADGREVVVVYNSNLAESKALAFYYARQRDVPANQIIGLNLTDTEIITRTEFNQQLQKPIARQLERFKLWKIGPGELPGTNHTTIPTTRKVVQSKVRYLVLCYGVPLKISRDSDLKEAGEEDLRPELRRNEASVDSELACLPRVAMGYPLAGPFLNPLYAVTNATLLNPTNGILLVARLDGPNAEISRGLIDKSLQAETNGLWGRAYFDVRNIADPGYKVGDDWIRAAAHLTQQLGWDTIIDEGGDTFASGFPMSQIALYFGWYREHVSGPFALPEVEFMPGAFAYHLHSYSANTLRSTNTHWVGPLLAKGATVTMGCVDEPYLAGTPDLSVFAGRWIYFGFTFGEAAYAAQSVVSWQTTVVGDPLYRPFGKTLAQRHQTLVAQTNQLAEWSIARLVNLRKNQGANSAEIARALEDTPQTRSSAVLQEKLAELYSELGKPSSCLAAYERALRLNPSPQQRLRIRLALIDRYLAANHTANVREQYDLLIAEFPNHPSLNIWRQLAGSPTLQTKP